MQAGSPRAACVQVPPQPPLAPGQLSPPPGPPANLSTAAVVPPPPPPSQASYAVRVTLAIASPTLGSSWASGALELSCCYVCVRCLVLAKRRPAAA